MATGKLLKERSVFTKKAKAQIRKLEKIATWDGGNDSGWVEFESSEIQDIPNLEDEIYNTLDYGSWAGSWSSTGSVRYDKEEDVIVLEGDEYDEENKTHIETINIEFDIPSPLYIDSVSVSVTSWDEEIRVRCNILNGAITPNIKKFEKSLTKKIEDALSEYMERGDDEYSWYLDDAFVISNDMKQVVFSIAIEQATHTEIYKTIEL